jgi:hypothetical protein
MAERDPVLAAWQAAGTELTMLPSGMEVRLEPVPVAEMVRSGVLPGQLRALAMRFAAPEGVTPSELDVAERAKWDELERLMISRWVVAVRWTCECPDCLERRAEPIEEQPYRLTPDVLAADPPVMPRVDLVALHDLVVYARTPKQVDAISRVAHGQMDEASAAAIVEREQVNTLTGWASFRDQRRGLDADADGQGVGPAPVGVPGPNRAARRAATRRRPRGKAAAGEPTATNQPAGS